MSDETFAKAEAERARKFGAPEGDEGIVRCDAAPCSAASVPVAPARAIGMPTSAAC
jgi:hypothetical protein